MNKYDLIEIFKIMTRFRLEEIYKHKFPMLEGMKFSSDDILDLISFSLNRHNGL